MVKFSQHMHDNAYTGEDIMSYWTWIIICIPIIAGITAANWGKENKSPGDKKV
jgi:hypothetical protein